MGAVTLGKLGDMRAVKPLIGLLSSTYHDKPAAREALESITGQNFRFDKNKWLAWLEKQDAAVESAAV